MAGTDRYGLAELVEGTGDEVVVVAASTEVLREQADVDV